MESVGEFEYSTKDLIGHGAFAVVFKGRHKKNLSLTVAVKSITKKNLSKSQNLLGKEIKILKELTELHHENVVALLDCKETAHHVNLVMEYCNGGDLADYLHAKGTLSEDTIRIFLRQIAGAMKALNAKGIVHRDLKPQNILLCNLGKKSNPAPSDIILKIADFGFARFLQDGVMAATLCGSPMYMAPEVIMSLQYDAKADLWSIGTIVFQCLTSKAPFQAQTPQALKQFYEKNVRLAPKIPGGTSYDLTDLLYKMLKRNSKDRLEFDEFFNHPFLKKGLKPSSAVPIPSSREHRRSKSISSQSPSSPVNIPGRRSISMSPVDSNSAGSRSPPMATVIEKSEIGNSTKISIQRTISPSEEHDYVVVPSNPPLDNSYESTSSARSPNKRIADSPRNVKIALRDESPTSSSSRPTFLPVTTSSIQKTTDCITVTRQQSLPIPVPSQKEAYLQLTNKNSLESGSPSPTRQSPSSPVPMPKSSIPRSNPISMRRRSSSGGGENNRRSSITSTDISSLSPPSVQFSVGTPPSICRRKYSTSSPVLGTKQPLNQQRYGSSGGTPPLSGSPLRKMNNVSPPVFNAQCVSAATGLSTILGSPTKFGATYEILGNENELLLNAACSNQDNQLIPICTRAKTLPELCNCGANQNLVDKDLLRKSGSAGRIADKLFCMQHNSNNPHSVMLQWSPGKTMHSCNSPLKGNGMPYNSFGNSGGLYDSNNCCSDSAVGPNPLPFGMSPPNMDGPIKFIPPELPEETLLAKEHNETLAKLNFVLTLVDCIIELAKSKAAPIPPLTESTCRNENTTGDGYKKAEQLVLYMRLLQMLSSSLTLAQDEIKANRLQSSSSVRQVLSNMNNRFKFCLTMCKSLNVSNVLQSCGIDPSTSMITADRLIYNYAIEMCQAAALDELFGNPQELSSSQQSAEKNCFKRYQTAQILLHSLSQQIGNDQDKSLLIKYKEAVEKRLCVIQNQGYHFIAYDS